MSETASKSVSYISAPRLQDSLCCYTDKLTSE